MLGAAAVPKQIEADVVAWKQAAREKGIWAPQPQLDVTQYAMTAAAGRAYGVFGYMPPPIRALDGPIVSGRHYRRPPSGIVMRPRRDSMEAPDRIAQNKALIMRNAAATFQNTTLGPLRPKRKNPYTTQELYGFPGVAAGITG